MMCVYIYAHTYILKLYMYMYSRDIYSRYIGIQDIDIQDIYKSTLTQRCNFLNLLMAHILEKLLLKEHINHIWNRCLIFNF